MTNPATETKSIGLLAFASAGWRIMVFASPSGQLYHDEAIPARLSGLFHQDSFIWTGKLSSVYRDFAKTHANPDTDGNFPYHRAVSIYAGCDTKSLYITVNQCIMTTFYNSS